jgi:hypothetical protein
LNMESWIVDSGASSHMTFCRESSLLNYKTIVVKDINQGNGSSIQAIGMGDVKIPLNSGSKINTVLLRDVLFVPDLKVNLLSVSRLSSLGYRIEFCWKCVCGLRNIETMFWYHWVSLGILGYPWVSLERKRV